MTLSSPVPDVVDLPVASLPTGLRIGGQLSPGGAEPIDVVTVSGEESNSTHLSVRTARRHVKWTLFGDDPSMLRDEIRSSFKAMRRKDG